MFEVAERYVGFCKQKGLHPVSTAIAWVAAHPAVTAPIIGARSVEQLKDSLSAVKVEMTPELRAEIADLSRTPPPATDRSEELKVVKAAA
jgi:aryl-alcohol dehydrogenase-like predicted oxidoreductase